MMVKTDFQRGGAGDLVEYMQRDDDKKVQLRDHTGRELASEEIDAFVERSQTHAFERHLIVSPDPDASITESELDRGIRDTMRQFRADKHTTEYVYALHTAQQNPHAHVAIIGPERDLQMDKTDITQFREQAREAFREPELLKQRAPERIAERDHTAEPKQKRQQRAQELDLEPERDEAGPKHADERDEQPERDRDPERDRGGHW